MRLGELRRAVPAGGLLVLEDTKNGDGRAVPVHPKIKHLMQYMPLDVPKVTIQRAWMRARVKAGLGDVHFHDLRHSTGSELVNAGVPLHVIGEVLGHRDPRSTKRYSHLKTETVAAAIAAIGKRPAKA